MAAATQAGLPAPAGMPAAGCGDTRGGTGAQGASTAAQDTSGASGAVGDWPDDLIEVGVVGEAYGVHGWIKVHPHAGDVQDASGSDSALLTAKHWWLLRGAERGAAKVMAARRHGGALVAQLAGCLERDAASALKGQRVLVRRADFPKLGADEFYWVDLIGLAVVNQQGTGLGTVTDLIDNGAHAILRVAESTAQSGAERGAAKAEGSGEEKAGQKTGQKAGQKVRKQADSERLIPFVDAYIKHVDQAARKIVVDWDIDY